MHIKFWLETPKGKATWVNETCKRYRAISCSYPCTDVTILHKNPTNALINVNTTLFALLHLLAIMGPSSGSTDTFRVQGQQNLNFDTYFVDPAHEMYQY